MRNYDLAIIGSGPGGYVAGLYASHQNIRIAVIEKEMIGGTCLNKGCIPTKVMLHSAALLSDIRSASLYGIDVSGFSVNFDKIVSRREEVVSKLRTSLENLLRTKKVDMIKGRARFTGPHTIEVDGVGAIEARSIIIAAGSRPSIIRGIRCDETDVLSSDGILKLTSLPKSLAIVGGGAIGCEFASFFSALGTKVVLIELLDRLIPAQSREASKKLELIFKKRGMDIWTSCKVESVHKDGVALKIKISNGREICPEKALVCIGRTPDTEGLGLDKALVKTEGGRITVDDQLRTSAQGVYGIGDCVDGPLLAHKASYDAIVACDNIFGETRKRNYSSIPNCIYSDPEIASVGISDDEAKARYPDCKVARFSYLSSGKAYLAGKTEGYIKLIGRSDGSLLGVEIFGAGACDLIGEAALASHVGVNIKDLSHVVHGHPTLSEIYQEAAHTFCSKSIHGV